MGWGEFGVLCAGEVHGGERRHMSPVEATWAASRGAHGPPRFKGPEDWQ